MCLIKNKKKERNCCFSIQILSGHIKRARQQILRKSEEGLGWIKCVKYIMKLFYLQIYALKHFSFISLFKMPLKSNVSLHY